MASFVPLIPLPVQYQDPITSVNMAGGSLEFFLSGTSTPTNLFSDSSGTSIGTSITLSAGGFPESGGVVITLFRDSSIALKIVGKNAAGTAIFTSDELKDGLVILASTANAEGASLIGIEDSGALIAGDDVEAALAEIAAGWLKKSGGTMTGNITFSSSAGMILADGVIDGANLEDYAIHHSVASSASNVIVFDLAGANSWVTTLTENITTVTLDNPSPTGNYCQISIKIIQDGGGGAFTVTWPASVLWPGGTAPVITVSNDAVDQVTLWTIDAGTTWYGNFSQAYA